MENKKCGEVFINEDELFNFLCTLCEASFEAVENFCEHIKGTHMNSKKYIVESYYNELESNAKSNRLTIKNEPNTLITSVHNKEIEFSEMIISDEDIENSSIITINQGIRNEYNLLEPKEESDSLDVVHENCESSGQTDNDNNSTDKSLKIKICNKKCTKINVVDNDEDYIQKQSDKEVENNLICKLCGKKFATAKSLKQHEKNVKCDKKFSPSGTKIHICDICGKKFKDKRNLDEHKYTALNGHKLTVTENLYKNLSRRVIRQLNEIETDGITLKCKYCGKFFRDSNKRLDHERIHTGEKPYQCQICGKQFRTKMLCTTHESRHTTEKLFKCEICNQFFKTKHTLYTHSQRHGEKKFSCSYCDKLFYHKSEQKDHERMHTGERPHKCTFCGRGFQTSSTLTRHKRHHLGIKPYKCKYCDKNFYRKDELNRHQHIHKTDS